MAPGCRCSAARSRRGPLAWGVVLRGAAGLQAQPLGRGAAARAALSAEGWRRRRRGRGRTAWGRGPGRAAAGAVQAFATRRPSSPHAAPPAACCPRPACLHIRRLLHAHDAGRVSPSSQSRAPGSAAAGSRRLMQRSHGGGADGLFVRQDSCACVRVPTGERACARAASSHLHHMVCGMRGAAAAFGPWRPRLPHPTPRRPSRRPTAPGSPHPQPAPRPP